MMKFLKHRAIAVTLAAVFGVFNIGIPVVLASCPMAKLGNAPTCFMCNEGEGNAGVQLKTHQDRSCCATVIAAEKNATEFLQSSHNVVAGVELTALLPAEISLTTTVHNAQFVIGHPRSPSPPDDLPILYSSLLI
jgi:hypothetical protein